ncbi:MAG TPA: class I SAM-dependent methyltransferase [Vicinamibacterales bacterium]|jgi:SAM-dependent methyltransferase|nr:class I SAM-dependent methyltransferase [Vicinamibacterales bacterium]
MFRLRTLVLSALIVACTVTFPRAQSAPPISAADQRVFDAFMTWMTSTPDSMKGDVEANYRAELRKQGVPAGEIDRRIKVVEDVSNRVEADRWNRVLTASTPSFNTKPNAFLVDMIRDVKPGAALDVGMGQGRNAIYLAQQGWTVTGFDPADRAVATAQQEASRLGVKLTTFVMRDDQFEFKKDAWDLVVLSYVGVRENVARVFDTLKPGGLVVVEGFHRDATRSGPIGEGVVFDTNELLQLFSRFRVLRYEDTDATADFGLKRLRVVRLCAQKPAG